MDETDKIPLLVAFACKDEQEMARVIEVMSRPITGLVLDGVMVTIMKGDVTD